MDVVAFKGRDVSAPVQHVIFKGQRFPMVFNNRAARIAEDVYADEYGRDIGYYAILDEVTKPKHAALMAMTYAAIVAGGADITWEDFDANFSLDDIEGFSQAIRKGLTASLPDEDPDADEDEKNVEPTPTE